MTETGTQTAWKIKVHNLECCNCRHGCGCQFGGFPDYGPCEAILAYEVIEGHYGQLDLKGAQAVFAVKWPKAIHEGNGSALLFLDEHLPEDQANALVRIFTGQEGGMPWEAIAQTLTSFEGPVRKPIHLTVQGKQSQVEVPGALEVRFESLVDPVSGQKKEVQIVYPNGGFFWDQGNVGTTRTMRVDYGDFCFEYPGQFAAYATPVWTNQA